MREILSPGMSSRHGKHTSAWTGGELWEDLHQALQEIWKYVVMSKRPISALSKGVAISLLRDGNIKAQKGICRRERLGMLERFAACHKSRRTAWQQPQQLFPAIPQTVFEMLTTQLRRRPASRLHGSPIMHRNYNTETLHDIQLLA